MGCQKRENFKVCLCILKENTRKTDKILENLKNRENEWKY